MKIYEAKENITTALKLLHNFKQNPDQSLLKGKITDILTLFTSEAVENLKKKLKKNVKKRNREALFRKRCKEEKEELRRRRQRQSDEVDRLLYQHQEEQQRAKTEESVRRQADVVLHAVTRRKAEARRVLTLLPALSRLRAGRCQQDVARGGTPSSAVTEAFETALGHLRGLWEKQLDEYTAEESGLKVMLAEGSATRLGQAERNLDSILHEWRVAMFGEGFHPELTWQQLVSIRAEWDQFIVAPDTHLSSSIPVGWLLPQPIRDNSWRNAVVFEP